MAGHALTHPGPDPAARQRIDGYLAAVARHLPGPARARAAILAELHDGLLEATSTHLATGLPPDQASRTAIGEFGQPHTLAAAFVPELAGHRARTVALTVLGTGPLLGLLWANAVAASHLAAPATLPLPPWQWPHPPTGLHTALPVLATAVLLGVTASLLTLAATGRPARWLNPPTRLAPTGAAAAGLGVSLADLTLLALLAAQVLTAPQALPGLPLAVAALASLCRLAFATHAARRMLTLRATLTLPSSYGASR